MFRIRRLPLILSILQIITVSNTSDDIIDYIKSFEIHKFKSPQQPSHSDENKKTLLLTKLEEPQILNILNKELAKELNQTYQDANNNNKGHQQQMPEFRLHKKTIQISSELESKYKIYQNLTKILDERQPSNFGSDQDNAFSNEILFNALKTQLGLLCCNKHQDKIADEKEKLPSKVPSVDSNVVEAPALNLFIMFNEEIKGPSQKDGLVMVDPNSLSNDSIIFPLGSIPESTDNDALKAMILQISDELLKPRYIPILSKLTAGKLEGPKAELFNYLNRPQTRRYIKPHRCNYQAPLSKVFGGTRFIICTGYLNINNPSIYDR